MKRLYLLSHFLFAASVVTFASAQVTPRPAAQEGAAQSPRPAFMRIPAAFDPATVERGQKLFGQSCAFCHGKEANGGDGGPDLIRSVLVNHDEHGELIGPVVTNGRPDKGMPKFNLTPAQIADIATFLHARNRDVRYRQLYQTKDLLTGDAKAGETYFSSHCNSCHSPTGDLTHIASKYQPEALLTRFLYPNKRPSADKADSGSKSSPTVTVKLSSGQTFDGPLKHLDEFTVSMYDAAGDYHSWARQGIEVTLHDPLAGHLALLQKYSDADMHNILAYLETLK